MRISRIKSIHKNFSISRKAFIYLAMICLFILFLAGCNSFENDELSSKKTQIKGTEIEIRVKQTLKAGEPTDQAIEDTHTAEQATIQAQSIIQTDAAGLPNSSDLDQTAQALQSTQIPQETINATQDLVQTPILVSDEELDAFMKSANILLYEDMIGRTDTIRYVKKTLETMGLSFKDVGSALGWFNEAVNTGASDGKPWDLVIIAAEDKTASQGSFFSDASTLLDKGASVILETWDIDKTGYGTAQNLLSACGVEHQLDYYKIPPARQVLFTLAPDHPVLREPNSGLTFTKTTSFWWDSTGKQAYDVGDLLQIASGGDARLLLGTMAEDITGHGTLTVCMEGRLTLQTFSSHSFTFDVAGPLWENYIHNALKMRMLRNP